MPSLLNKLLHPTTGSSKKQNPYANPDHPNHLRTSPPAPTSTTAEQTFSALPLPILRSQPPRPASPREPHDYLAEAREASGRDSVTGRLRNPSGQPSSVGGEARREGQSVYQETSEGRSRTHRTKYDLFVQEMKARKGGRWRAPDGGFYAPERRLGEFYQPERSGPQGPGR